MNMTENALNLVRNSGMSAIAAECHRLAVAQGKYVDGDERSIEKGIKALAGEVIELASSHAIDRFLGMHSKDDGPTDPTIDEFGDVLANTLSLAIEMGIDVERALRDAMQRNAERVVVRNAYPSPV